MVNVYVFQCIQSLWFDINHVQSVFSVFHSNWTGRFFLLPLVVVLGTARTQELTHQINKVWKLFKYNESYLEPECILLTTLSEERSLLTSSSITVFDQSVESVNLLNTFHSTGSSVIHLQLSYSMEEERKTFQLVLCTFMSLTPPSFPYEAVLISWSNWKN